MDKNKATAIIEGTFDKAFNKQVFTLFVQNLLNDIDMSENKYREYRGNLIKESFRTHISQYTRMGKYIDPNGIALDVLVVEVQDESKLDKARTSLRNFVIDHLEKFEKDYALAAFYSKTDCGRNWRFSFIKLEHHTNVTDGKIKQQKEFTPAKRYSFLVGEDEKSHTAKRQLLPLLQNVYSNPTIEDIEKAFSIEVVTDEFFGQYKELFLHVSEHLETNISTKNALELAGTDIPRFTKKLLGQIVFLYFLQKKGWLGVPQNDKWGTGQKNFLQSLFNKADNEGKNFFNSYLRFLFYEALARQHGEDNYYRKLDCHIPFLNGGLFEANYEWENYEINLPNILFRNNEKVIKTGDIGTGILDVFDRYNFTIREDEPLEKEVAIDPEMLGKVFENMLEITERKSKGAFYTPREIVHYMCQESLIHYLNNTLNQKTSYEEFGTGQTHLFGNEANIGQLDIYNEHNNAIVPKIDIEDFIHNCIFYIEHDNRVADKGKETETYNYKLPETIRKNVDQIDKLLTNIKICDPAIGSGAFPVGLLNELVTLQLVLIRHLSDSYLSQKLKRIGLKPEEYDRHPEKYAYRVKRHSIQESIYGVDIDASAIDIARLRLWLSLVVDEEDFDNIEALPNLDYKIVCGNSLIGLPENAMHDLNVEKELENLKETFFAENNELRKKELRLEINKKIRELLDSAESFANYKIDFDFKLFFSEVWRENGGFDIVIGNPPYVQLQKNGGELSKLYGPKKEGKKTIPSPYQTYDSMGDIYSLFYERGYQLLKQHGRLCFITSNKWMRAGYGENTRKFFVKNTNPEQLIDFAGVKVFESATVDTNILMFSKDKNRQQTKACIVKKDGIKDLSVFIRQNSTNCNFSTDSWVILSPIEQSIKAKIEAVGTPLKDWDIQINYGIKTGFNEAFIISGEKRKELIEQDPKSAELIRPILRGRDIKRYGYEFADLYLITTFPSLKIDIGLYPAVKQHLLSFGYDRLKQTGELGARKKTNNQWFETQDSISYWEDFYKQKIVWKAVGRNLAFSLLEEGSFLTAPASFITSDNNLFLLGILCSSYAKYFIYNNSDTTGAGDIMLNIQSLEKLPIPILSPENQTVFCEKVSKVLEFKQNSTETILMEKELNKMIYDIFNFDMDEIEFIENQ